MTEQDVIETYGEVIWTGKPRNFFGLAINFTRYIITNNKVITRKGLFSLKEDEIELYRIMDKQIEMPFGQRIFGCGTLLLSAKDSDTPTKVLKSIKEPREVAGILEKRLMELRNKYRIQQREMFGSMNSVGDMDMDMDMDEENDEGSV